MTFFIYSRKSVYTGKGESIENQIEMCKQYIHSKFSDVADADITIYEDEGFSAKNIDRPQFQQMLRDIKLQKPDYVVCYRLDRISRNVSDFSALIEDLNDRSISFVCIKEEFDTSKPMGKAMMYIASVFAQLERETIAERVRDNMLMLARTGRWLGGTTPTGYTSEKIQEIIIDGKVKTSCKLKDNPGELGAVDTMFEKFLELRSMSGVSKYLMKQGIKSRSGNFYSLLGIKEILQNPVYCIADKEAFDYFTVQGADVCFKENDCRNKYGLLAYNKRDYKKKHAPRQSMDKWIVAIGKHKGRISGKKWVAVQNIIENNIPTGKKPAKMHNDYSLLSGLIYCAKCGSRMFAKQRSGKGANPDLYDYVCNSKLRGGIELCDCQNIGGPQADDRVCEHLMKFTDENSSIYKLLERLKSDLQGQVKENPLDAIDARIKKCNEEMNNLVNTLSEGNLGFTFVQRVNTRMTELGKELSALMEERERLQKDTNISAGREIQVDMLTASLSSLKNCFGILSIYEKRTLIKLLAKKIVWDGKDLHIFVDGE
ncbi:MAG: recombinase family protein [Clostridiales bacterium]|nr:MAG: recombinase family protein [Clostridiales bacterium]